MKSNGWHFVHGGREIWRATKAEISRLAQKVADSTGRAVKVKPGRRPKKRPATSSPSRASRPTSRRVMKPNPDPLAYLGVWRLQEENRAHRLARNKATKARRIAKSLPRRSRGGRAVVAGEKTIKFRVDVKRGREQFSMGRPSRAAAERLAQEFMAAGYSVKVSEA